MKKILGALLLFSYCLSFAMEIEQTADLDEQKKIVIDAQLIAEFRDNGFHDFIDQKKKEFSTLTSATNIPVFGSVVSWGLETFGDVKVDEAKLFLGRIFDAEKEFRDFVSKLEHDMDNIEYLQGIFNNLPHNISTTKSKSDLVVAMRSVRHKRVPTPKQMGEKNHKSEYSIKNDDFLPFAACNLWAMHWLAKQEGSPKRLRKKKPKK